MEIKKVDFGVWLRVKGAEHPIIDEGGEDVSYLEEVLLPLAEAMKPECIECEIRTFITEENDDGRTRTIDFNEEFSDGNELVEFLEKITKSEKFLDIEVTEGIYKYLNEKLAEMARPPERQAWE